MNFVKVIEHNGEIYRIGDEIEVVFDSGVKASGKIKGFDTYGFLESGLEDGVEFGKYCVPFTDIIDIKKCKKISNETMNFAVAVLAEVTERSNQEGVVCLLDVENAINKYLNE